MKIVFMIDSWTEGNGGGVAAMRVVKELQARGHQIRIVSTGEHYDEDFEFYQVPGFTMPFVRKGMEKMNFEFAKWKPDTLRRAFKGADLVHVYYPFFIASKAIKMANEMGIPVTGASHVQPQNVLGAMNSESRVIKRILTFIFKKMLYANPGVSAIHSPSVFAAGWLRNNGSTAHIRVISNGIPPEYHPIDVERPDWFGDKFVILYIGRHVLEKRQELLIDGLLQAKHKDHIQLLLCGKGPDTGHLKERGQELPVKPFIDYVSEEDKKLYLNTADLYVHPSLVELESISTLEAIGCGLPALISDSPHSAASQFALNDDFLFYVDNADSLGERLDYWYEHRDLLREMRKHVLEMAGYYRMDRIMDALEAFFADAAAGRAAQMETLVETGHKPCVIPVEPADKKVALGGMY